MAETDSAVGRTFTSCRATATPSTVTLASFTHFFASAREQYPRRDKIRSTRSGFAVPPPAPFAFAATARRAGLGTGLGATCQGAPHARIALSGIKMHFFHNIETPTRCKYKSHDAPRRPPHSWRMAYTLAPASPILSLRMMCSGNPSLTPV